MDFLQQISFWVILGLVGPAACWITARFSIYTWIMGAWNITTFSYIPALLWMHIYIWILCSGCIYILVFYI